MSIAGYRRGFVEACLERAPAAARTWIADLEAVAVSRVAPAAAALDRDAGYPQAPLAALGELGVFGVAAPESAGGLGFGDGVAALAVETIAAACASTAAIVMFHTQVVRRVVRHGTQRQRQDDLPRLASGEWRGVSAWAEPGAGADKGAIRSRLHHGAGDWRMTALKTFVTGLEGADLVHVLVGTATRDGAIAPTFVRLAARSPHVRTVDIYDLVGLRGSSTGTMRIDDAPVTGADLLGELGSGRRLMADNHTAMLNPGCSRSASAARRSRRRGGSSGIFRQEPIAIRLRSRGSRSPTSRSSLGPSTPAPPRRCDTARRVARMATSNAPGSSCTRRRTWRRRWRGRRSCSAPAA
jgi:alkylation response protein AidB-like acyl-CoA dehydrogenase